MNEFTLWLFVGLLTKHFIVDFPLQVPYHYLNKGMYGHPGGIQHAGFHGIGTALVLVLFSVRLDYIILLAFLDTVVHYHIDWAKMNLNRGMGWKPDNSEQFWWLLGLDQYLHHLTYALIIYLLIK